MEYCINCMKEIEQKGTCPFCGYDNNTYRGEGHHLRPNTILNGKYLIGRVLGEGGFGITYVGLDLNLEMKVAVKEYYPNGCVTRGDNSDGRVAVMSGKRTELFQKGQEQFIGEARRLAKFWGLPGIVAVKDFFQENGTAYIVMEFAEGKNLKQVLEQVGGKIGAESFIKLMRQVMHSLQTVHEAGMIHRDISPDNLIVDPKGNLKLLDFGAARNYMAENEKSLSVILKPGYAPEEQYRSRGNQGPWTDVYALCATIYRAITGRVPVESLDRLAGEELELPSRLGIKISAQQEKVLMKGLALKAEDRYQSMKELEEALFAEGAKLEVSKPEVQPTQPVVEKTKPVEEKTVPVQEKTQPYVESNGKVSWFGDSSNEDRKDSSVRESVNNKKAKKGKKVFTGIVLGGCVLAAGYIGVNNFMLLKRTVTYANGERYEGQMRGKIQEGFGTYYYSDGSYYKGEWEDGMKHGSGSEYYPYGDYYEGEWEDGMKHGSGTYYWADGERYEGEWEDGMRNGTGICYYLNGNYYEGEWKDEKRSGTGTYYWADGSYYEGKWQDGKKHGEGIYYDVEGNVEECVYENDERVDILQEFIVTYDNGDRYEGQMRGEVREGTGTYYWADGTRYEGEWKDDVRHGSGTYYDADGNAEYRAYENGNRDLNQEKMHRIVEILKSKRNE